MGLRVLWPGLEQASTSKLHGNERGEVTKGGTQPGLGRLQAPRAGANSICQDSANLDIVVALRFVFRDKFARSGEGRETLAAGSHLREATGTAECFDAMGANRDD